MINSVSISYGSTGSNSISLSNTPSSVSMSTNTNDSIASEAIGGSGNVKAQRRLPQTGNENDDLGMLGGALLGLAALLGLGKKRKKRN
ncbi:LPXTG cell wall anchor domain-containing protein [Limosilactobacillus caecicola]|uniref:LPXTG cell wall anchor domain-containing protein n=1 Tax=Limosilactobacillus caecicola TaxID=2941332 RepID=UPI00204128AB|nr:LPXTG cell wall anchor domain-containing protein [Limosilactobacillus caecicola]